MKINDWLSHATSSLKQAGIGTARLDALVIAEDTTKQDRAYLLAHPDYPLNKNNVDELNSKLKRRLEHEPLAYIRGKTEFYGREFLIDSRVLEPRPESETMIELLKALPQPINHIADIGTGSGALAITAKLELPSASILAIDIDTGCLAIARKNATKHQVDVMFKKSDLAKELESKDYVLLCNLPYVPDNFTINPAAMREPKLAIFGGEDGLDLYRQLFGQITDQKLNVRYILSEALPTQHEALAKIAIKHNYRLIESEDFIQVFATE